MLNYDPDSVPEVDPSKLKKAAEFGMHPIHITCDEHDALDGSLNFVSFIAHVHFVPREGESIQIEDGSYFRVKSVQYKVADNDGYKSMIPNVYAVKNTK